MKYLKHLSTCLLLFVTFISCAQQDAKPELAPDKTQNPGTAEVKTYRNLRYAAKPEGFEADTSSDRLLDLYLPANPSNAKLPVFMFVHGGGFSGGDKQAMMAFCTKLAGYGYAVLSINYRLHLKQNKIPGASASANMAKGLRPNGQFTAGLQDAVKIASDDAQMALGWIVAQAKQYSFDPQRVAISGGSAGAMTVLHTAYISNQKVVPIKAVVDLWGGLEDEKQIKKGAAPLLIYHGDKDALIHVDYAHALHNQMLKIGNTQSVLHVMEGTGHAAYNFITKEKIPEIVAFLEQTLK